MHPLGGSGEFISGLVCVSMVMENGGGRGGNVPAQTEVCCLLLACLFMGVCERYYTTSSPRKEWKTHHFGGENNSISLQKYISP